MSARHLCIFEASVTSGFMRSRNLLPESRNIREQVNFAFLVSVHVLVAHAHTRTYTHTQWNRTLHGWLAPAFRKTVTARNLKSNSNTCLTTALVLPM